MACNRVFRPFWCLIVATVLCSPQLYASSEVWSAGYGGSIYHFDGASWQQASTPTSDNLRTIAMATASHGWAGGEGVLLRWDGLSWVSEPFPAGVDAFVEIVALSPSIAWAVGWTGNPKHVVALRWDGLAWQTVPLPAGTTDGHDDPSIFAESAAEAWIATYNPFIDGPRLFHWTGASWQITDLPQNNDFPFALDFFSPQRGWITGDKYLWELDSGTWQQAFLLGGVPWFRSADVVPGQDRLFIATTYVKHRKENESKLALLVWEDGKMKLLGSHPKGRRPAFEVHAASVHMESCKKGWVATFDYWFNGNRLGIPEGPAGRVLAWDGKQLETVLESPFPQVDISVISSSGPPPLQSDDPCHGPRFPEADPEDL